MKRSFCLLFLTLALTLAACSPKPMSPEQLALSTAAPPPTGTPVEQKQEWREAKQTFDRRCVVCHGCYDSPCQLVLSSFEGIERGATKAKVYDGSRLLAAEPTRLHVDAHGVEAWRLKGFYPVLPEGPGAEARGSLSSAHG